MDVHLKELFGSFHQQFGANTGNGGGSSPPLFPDCMLSKIDGVSMAFIKSILRACAALYLSNPWQRLRPHHLLGVSVHGSEPFFVCAHFVGNAVSDPALFLYRSHEDALSCLPTSPTRHAVPDLKTIPSAGILRLTFTSESRLPLPHKKMIKGLGVEVAGPKAFPFIDIIYPSSSMNGSSFRAMPLYGSPSFRELRWLFACVKAITQVHPLLQQHDSKGLRGHRAAFEELSQSVDVQWPAEDAKFWEVTSVRIMHPPHQENLEDHRTLDSNSSGHLEAEVDLNGWLVSRQCAMCGIEVSAESAPRCSRCKAVIYCGHACQKQHWKEQHKGSCELFKAMMEREEELELKGFSFPCLMEQSCKWLESVGLHGKGMWRRMCACFMQHEFGLLPVFFSGKGVEEAWGLENGMYPSDTPLLDNFGAGENTSMVLLSGWAEYYNLRGLSMASPVAALLSYPLSLYHIVTALNAATKAALAKGKEIVVHYLGPEGELDWIPAFSELAYLLGGSGSLHIVMIGPDVPLPLSGASTQAGPKLKLTYVKGLYQNELDSLPSPQVVVALHVGLELYDSWMGALEAIKSQSVAAFFTDNSEPCCANAKQVLRAAGLHISYPVTPNPFRSPVRSQNPSSNIPWYSNGFILGVNT